MENAPQVAKLTVSDLAVFSDVSRQSEQILKAFEDVLKNSAVVAMAPALQEVAAEMQQMVQRTQVFEQIAMVQREFAKATQPLLRLDLSQVKRALEMPTLNLELPKLDLTIPPLLTGESVRKLAEAFSQSRTLYEIDGFSEIGAAWSAGVTKGRPNAFRLPSIDGFERELSTGIEDAYTEIDGRLTDWDGGATPEGVNDSLEAKSAVVLAGCLASVVVLSSEAGRMAVGLTAELIESGMVLSSLGLDVYNWLSESMPDANVLNWLVGLVGFITWLRARSSKP